MSHRQSINWFAGLFVFLCVICTHSLSAQSPTPADPGRAAKLKERDTQWAVAQTAKSIGDFKAAITAAEETLVIDRGIFGDEHEEVTMTLKFLASCEEASEQWEAAQTRREDVQRRTIRAFGEADYRVIDARQALKHLSILKNLTREQLQSLREATLVNGRIIQFCREGKFAAGINLAQNNVRLRETILGPDHPETANSLRNLAALHHWLGNYAVAEPLFQRVLRITEIALGPEHPDIADGLRNLALLRKAQSKYAAAEPLYHQALRIRENAFGPEHPDTAQSLNDLAELYRLQGNYGAAEPLCQRALSITEKALGPDHPAAAEGLNTLAALYVDQVNYAAAHLLLQRALKIKEKALGPDHPAAAEGLNNLAELYRRQGNYAAAEPLYQRALKIWEKALGPNHPNTANSLNNLAVLYYSQSNYAAAEPLYQQSLKIKEKNLGPDHPDTGVSLSSLASLYSAHGNYAAAEPLYQRALVISEEKLGPDHPRTANNISALAGLYKSQSNYATAGPLYQRALKIVEKASGPDHPLTADELNNLAVYHAEQSNYAAAEPLCQRALKIRENALGPDHTDTAESLNNLAGLYYSQANFAAAEPLYQRALKITEEALGPENPKTVSIVNNLAVLFWDQQRDDDARHLVSRNPVHTIAQLERTAVIQSETQQFLMTKNKRDNIDLYLTLQEADTTTAKETWGALLNWKGLITTRQTRLRQVLKNELEYVALQRVIQQLSRHLINPPRPPDDPKLIAAWNEKAPAFRKAWQDQRTKLESEYERFEKELSQKSAIFCETLRQQQVTVGELQQLLMSQKLPTALVDLVEYQYRTRGNGLWERRIAAFVIRADGMVTRVELGSAQQMARLIRDWRSTFGRDDKGQEAARRLRERLWQPLTAALAGAKVVLISPDGVLGEFPWNALPGATPGSFLLEEISLAVIPVPQMLPQLLQAEPKYEPPATLLLAGDIAYDGDAGAPGDAYANRAPRQSDDDRSRPFGLLPAAQAELASIEKRYLKQRNGLHADTLEGTDATEAAFRQLAPDHQWLHVVTHGYFVPDIVDAPVTNKETSSKAVHPGLLSGLAFAGANTPPEEGKDDGILTALEVSALDLSQVNTVVLSACETGLGQVAGGEGLLGLQRAFQVAGAKTTVASLWKVPDRATATLMQRFYENLWDKKMGKLEALRLAQIWMLRDNDNRGLAIADQPTDKDALPPYYWAAFVLSGDWR